ncbi:Sec-independent protein translocase protein TatB [Methylophilus sp. Leaf416]|uniref:Sec-independent protein translocase protein TatB n=1 Tax=unclassified Methylophilus TaxID=2630143 RepID=UPI0009E885DB|nr:Sec-independent protein translocase protein TatB [Methylophilus sp. Leaf416]
MFDISFSEMVVIAIVALIVIGPEKLPKVARTAGAFFGRLQRFVTQVKDEVNRESRFAELQKLQEEVQSSLQQNYADIEQSILPPTSQVNEPASVESVKKPRKPRQAKVKDLTSEQAVIKPPRRSKAADELNQSATVQDATSEGSATPESLAPVSASVPRPRKTKPKATIDTADMFTDEHKS